jgi:hypothetical protein
MLYGNSSNGYGYSPNRSREVDRYNTSTQQNYNRPNFNRLNEQTYYSNNNYWSNFWKNR